MKLSDQTKFITIPIHILFLVSCFLIDWDYKNLLAILAVWSLIGGLGIATGYHKLFSHKSFETFDFVKKIMVILGTLSLQGSVLFWVSVHRGIHHRYSDTEKDIHSPIHGLLYSYILWHNDLDPKTINLMYARDLLKDKFISFQHEHYKKLFWFLILLSMIISYKFCLGVLIPACLLAFHQDNIVNILGHSPRFGYRNFETKDNSTNNWQTGLLCWGQGWHNNHHANPHKANFGSVKWWEFDPAYQIFVKLIRTQSNKTR